MKKYCLILFWVISSINSAYAESNTRLDYAYMQNNDALEGWMFINHLAIQVHHKIYELLKTQKMVAKYSIRDFIEYLSDIRRVSVNDQWVLESIIKEQQALLTKLGISIT